MANSSSTFATQRRELNEQSEPNVTLKVTMLFLKSYFVDHIIHLSLKIYEVIQLLSNSTDWITERGNTLNEHVLCDIEWSCDMRVVWLESKAAMELTPHIWTRSVFDLRLRLNLKMQQCGCNLRQLTELITLDSICFPDLHKNKNKIKFSQKHVC